MIVPHPARVLMVGWALLFSQVTSFQPKPLERSLFSILGARRGPIRRPVRNTEAKEPLPQDIASKDPTLLSSSSWDAFQMNAALRRAVTQGLMLKQPTQIQAESYEHIRTGKSVLGRSRTGSGKTVAFLLPALQHLSEQPFFLPGRQVGILVVAPTRELAQQIANTASQLTSELTKEWKVQCMYGGTRMARDIAPWRQGQLPVVLVSTPGRLMDHLQDTRLKGQKFGDAVLSQVSIVVLDETDRLVEGFRKELIRIESELPRKRQRLMFSATLPPRLHMEDWMPEQFVKVDCVDDSDLKTQTSSRVVQTYQQLERMVDYVPTLLALLSSAEESKAVVFFPTAKLVRFFCEFCDELGISTTEIHSRMSQGSRSRVSSAFRKANRGILLSSDVSARGLDYPDVSLVIQYGAPFSEDLYLHRLGRTARAGKEGTGIQVLLPFESGFERRLKKRRVSKKEPPMISPDLQPKLEQLRQAIRSGHKSLTPKAQAAYMSMVAYYLEYADRQVHGPVIAAAAQSFCEGIGLEPEPLPEEMQAQLKARPPPKPRGPQRRKKPRQ